MNKKSRENLPKTLDRLRELGHREQARLWARYVPHPYKRQLRALWYYINCENTGTRILPKYMVKIRKYMDNPDACMQKAYKRKYNLTPGAEIVKTFRGLEFRVTVADNGDFLYAGKTYRTLSAVAREICGKKVSGYDFFGLDNKKTKSMF